VQRRGPRDGAGRGGERAAHPPPALAGRVVLRGGRPDGGDGARARGDGPHRPGTPRLHRQRPFDPPPGRSVGGRSRSARRRERGGLLKTTVPGRAGPFGPRPPGHASSGNRAAPTSPFASPRSARRGGSPSASPT